MRWIHCLHEFYTCVDESDYDLVSQYLWRFFDRGYARNQKNVFLHHFLMGKPKKGYCIDHINRCPWDNRRSNLKIVSISENTKNSGIPTEIILPTEAEKIQAKNRRKELRSNTNKYSQAAKRNENWKAAEKPVMNDLGEIFPSIKNAARQYNTAHQNISKVIHGKRNTCAGRIWFFLD